MQPHVMVDPVRRDEAVVEDDGIRKAALLIHTLSNADRRWMLAQLPESQRGQLLALVDELRELGIPPAPTLLDDVMTHPVPLAPDFAPNLAPNAASLRDAQDPLAARQGNDEQVLRHIEQASAAIVWPLLRNEPAGLIARLLSLHDWPWATGMAQWLDATRRKEIRALLETGDRRLRAGGAELDTHLLSLLSSRLQAASVASTASAAEVVSAPFVADRRDDFPVRDNARWWRGGIRRGVAGR